MENVSWNSFSLFKEKNILSELFSRLFIQEFSFMQSHHNPFFPEHNTIQGWQTPILRFSQHWCCLILSSFYFLFIRQVRLIIDTVESEARPWTLGRMKHHQAPSQRNHWVALGNLVRGEGEWGSRQTPVSKTSRHITKKEGWINLEI